MLSLSAAERPEFLQRHVDAVETLLQLETELGREKDQAQVLLLRRTLEEQRGRGDRGPRQPG